MKAKQLLLICVLFLISEVKGQFTPTQNMFKHGLNGKVQSISESFSEHDSSSIEHSTIISEFNYTGYIQTVKRYKNDMLFSVLKYYYQSDSVPDYAVEYNSDGSEYLRITFETDENGFVKRSVCSRTEQKKFDVNRQPIDIEYHQFYQTLYDQVLIEHDFTGRLLSQKFLSSDDELFYTYEYEYDFRSNLTGIKYKNAKNDLVLRLKLLYNEHKLVRQQKIFRDNTLVEKITFSYEMDNYKNWLLRKAKHDYVNNIYNQKKRDKTETQARNITYFEE